LGSIMKVLLKAFLAWFTAVFTAIAYAQTNLNTSLGEQIVMVKKGTGFFSVDIETTLYVPSGDGPFPIAIVNHGKQSGDPKWQARYRPTSAARYFLARGYLVAVPMRQGFSKSTGQYIGGGCNVHSNGLAQAADVLAVIDYLKTQSFADASRIVMAGQSHGGLTTMAFGTLNHPDVKGFINFAGGLRQDSCAGWEYNLARAFSAYGETTKTPSIWFYGDNDSYWQPWLYKDMHQKYNANSTKAQLVAYGRFGSDAHGMFGSKEGEAIWQPEVTKFLAAIGLPSAVLTNRDTYLQAPGDMARPAATDFAVLHDEAKVPHIPEGRRSVYKDYLTKNLPRAFAIAPNGALGWANGGEDPMRRALEFCNRRGLGQCKLYSVDEEVVWNP
jgi:dienelactone hydrolase